MLYEFWYESFFMSILYDQKVTFVQNCGDYTLRLSRVRTRFTCTHGAVRSSVRRFSDGDLSIIDGKRKRSINGRCRPVYSVFRTPTRVSGTGPAVRGFSLSSSSASPGARGTDTLGRSYGSPCCRCRWSAVPCARQSGTWTSARPSSRWSSPCKRGRIVKRIYTRLFTGRGIKLYVVGVKNEYCKRSVNKTHTTFYGTWQKLLGRNRFLRYESLRP